MDYKRIHDTIINKAKNRNISKYCSKKYHKHHIVPRCENGNSNETVLLTHKEHKIVHLLRWKFTGIKGNLLAYVFMKGIISKYYPEEMLEIQKLSGSIGGKKVKKEKLGIFNPDYDRGLQSKITIQNGKGLGSISKRQQTINGQKGGNSCYQQKLGMFDEKYKDNKTIWAKQNGRIGGIKAKIKKAGFHSFTEEQKIENARKGGLKGGKIVGKMFWWNNGKINKKSFQSPGKEWKRGMIKQKKEVKDE